MSDRVWRRRRIVSSGCAALDTVREQVAKPMTHHRDQRSANTPAAGYNPWRVRPHRIRVRPATCKCVRPPFLSCIKAPRAFTACSVQFLPSSCTHVPFIHSVCPRPLGPI